MHGPKPDLRFSRASKRVGQTWPQVSGFRMVQAYGKTCATRFSILGKVWCLEFRDSLGLTNRKRALPTLQARLSIAEVAGASRSDAESDTRSISGY